MNYYNENDPKAAAWLRQLVADGHVPLGTVDERSIEDVVPGDLEGFTQCHFFAGIGGWSEALRLAGWQAARPVWTGSCPCQPFSAAGRQGGTADKRHLWPVWFNLIRECRPPVVFGEQVASKAGLGWLDIVQADLEGADYACGAVDLCAAGVGAPHLRNRLWFVGHPNGTGLEGRGEYGDRPGERPAWEASVVSCTDGKHRPVEPGTFPLAHGVPARVVRLRGYGNAIVPQVAAEVIKAYA